MKFSWTLAIAVAFIGYMCHSLWVIYTIFSPTPCVSTQHGVCIQPYLLKNRAMELQIFTSLKEQENMPSRDRTLIWRYDNFSVKETIEKTFNVSIPLKTRNNGTLYLHVYIHPKAHDLISQYTSHAVTKITAYAYPRAEVINLLGERKPTDNQTKPTQDKMISHWRQKVSVNVMDDLIAFERRAIPGEVFRYLRVAPDGSYLPMVFIDEMAFRMRDLLPLNTSSVQMPLTVTYSPISVGKLRMWTNFLQSFQMLQNLGFTEKDTDEIKGIFADTNFYFLLLTFAVAAFHLLFDFLAFKNEITYWKKRKTMVGLSTRAVIWRCISTIIIFFYLMDEKTSLLVLIPAGIGAIIEIWKVKKALKVSVSWEKGLLPTFKLQPHSTEEKETEAYDSQAMKYLSYLLYPLCLAGAVYSLLYVQHKSWYSWFLQSLVNGIYALGFLFMLPQLFVNYKLKSVAHLPWRAFMYKAFNTFIDDVFAFIITMPTAHRLACFRDDVVFIIYLYQRWLYPVDKKRVNEFGQSFEEEEKESKKTK